MEIVAQPPPTDLALDPVNRNCAFAIEGRHVWCGTIACDDDGLHHLFFSTWPRQVGFEAWVTHSQVWRATSRDALGPYAVAGPALEGAGGEAWDASVIHNPVVLHVGGKYYLYYTGNRGNRADWWAHRDAQRIGVAIADHPAGPWRRFDGPLVDVDPSSWDAVITSNPAVCVRPDGRILMIYKTVAPGPAPFGGKVLHAVATADHPTGPFVRQPDPIFTHAGVQFPAEDPTVWFDSSTGRYRAIVKDMAGHFTGAGTSLAAFESVDGVAWRPSANPLVSRTVVRWTDGTATEVHRLERPQVWLDNRRPRVLTCAALSRGPDPSSFIVAMGIR